MMKLAHFQRVGVFAPYIATPVTGIPKSNAKLEALTLATPENLDEIIDYLDVSNIFPAVGGIYYVGFVGHRISDRLLLEKILAGQIYLLRRWERLEGLAIAESPFEHQDEHRDDHLFIGYIDGTTEAIGLIAYMLRHRASELGLEKVRAHVPDLMMVRDAFAGAEYEWRGSILYTYEKSLVE